MIMPARLKRMATRQAAQPGVLHKCPVCDTKLAHVYEGVNSHLAMHERHGEIDHERKLAIRCQFFPFRIPNEAT